MGINQALCKSYRLTTIESLKGRISLQTRKKGGMKFRVKDQTTSRTQLVLSRALLTQIGGQQSLRAA